MGNLDEVVSNAPYIVRGHFPLTTWQKIANKFFKQVFVWPARSFLKSPQELGITPVPFSPPEVTREGIEPDLRLLQGRALIHYTSQRET